MTRDPAELADALLDGELSASEWNAARTADPAGCDRALAAAHAQRAALVGLARPALPDALRQRILAATSTAPAAVRAPTAAGRTWWQYTLPAALAAGFALAVWLPTRSESAPATPSAPAVARLDKSESTLPQTEELKVKAKREGAAQSASAPPAVSQPSLSDQASPFQAEDAGPRIATESAPEPGTDAVDGHVAAAPMTPSAPAAKADGGLARAAKTAAPSPIVLQLAWRVGARRDLADGEGLEPKANTADSATRSEGLATSAPTATSTQSEAVPAEAPASAFRAPAAPAATAAADAADRELLITLRNQTVGDLRIAAGGIRLVGVGSDGRAVWRTTLRGSSETVIPAGRSLGWVQQITVLPPGIDRLRLEVDGQRSTEIEP